MNLNRFQIAACKRTAQNIKKLTTRRDKLNNSIRELAKEIAEINAQIDAWEAPVKAMTGGYTSEQVLSWGGNIPDETPAEDSEIENNVEL